MKWENSAHLPVLLWGLKWDQVNERARAFSSYSSLMTLLSLDTSFLCRQEVCLLPAPELKSHSFYRWKGTGGFFLPWVKELRLAPAWIVAHPWTRQVYLRARGGSCRVSFCCCLFREKESLICQEKVAVLFRLNLRDALKSLGEDRPLPLCFKIVLHRCVIRLLGTPGFEFQLHPLVTFLWDRQIFLFHPPHFLLRIRWSKAAKRNQKSGDEGKLFWLLWLFPVWFGPFPSCLSLLSCVYHACRVDASRVNSSHM